VTDEPLMPAPPARGGGFRLQLEGTGDVKAGDPPAVRGSAFRLQLEGTRDAGIVREAIVLPAIFLTVALLGGFRIEAGTDALRFLPPPLMTLVLAVLLMALLVQGGVLAPWLLMNARRSLIENLSGTAVLVGLFAASAQVFNLLTPEAGMLMVLFDVVFLVLLANTAAAAPDRLRLLRSIAVVLGSAFVVKHVVLAALQGPGGGTGFRIVSFLFEGATLGTFAYPASGPGTGYVAFLTCALFLLGLVLLPHQLNQSRTTPPDDAGSLRYAELADG
jgi:hypothetical protein